MNTARTSQADSTQLSCITDGQTVDQRSENSFYQNSLHMEQGFRGIEPHGSSMKDNESENLCGRVSNADLQDSIIAISTHFQLQKRLLQEQYEQKQQRLEYEQQLKLLELQEKAKIMEEKERHSKTAAAGGEIATADRMMVETAGAAEPQLVSSSGDQRGVKRHQEDEVMVKQEVPDDDEDDSARWNLAEVDNMVVKQSIAARQCNKMRSLNKRSEYPMMLRQASDQSLLSSMRRSNDHLNSQAGSVAIDRLARIKNKSKDEESAVASTEVKMLLRETLLNKSRGNLQHPELPRHWKTQSSFFDQAHPAPQPHHHYHHQGHPYGTPRLDDSNSASPNNKQNAAQLIIGQYDDYPLRKTASEPNLKMRHKLFLRRHGGGGAHFPGGVPLPSHGPEGGTSHSNIRGAWMDGPGAYRRRHLVSVDSTGGGSGTDSGPCSPPIPPPPHSSYVWGGSGADDQEGSAEHMLMDSGSASTLTALRMMSDMVINQSLPSLSVDQQQLLPPDHIKQGFKSGIEMGGAGYLPFSPAGLIDRYHPPRPRPHHQLEEEKPMDLSGSGSARGKVGVVVPQPLKAYPYVPQGSVPSLLDMGPYHHPAALPHLAGAWTASMSRTLSEPMPLPRRMMLQQQQLQQHKDPHLFSRDIHHHQYFQKMSSRGRMEDVDETLESKMLETNMRRSVLNNADDDDEGDLVSPMLVDSHTDVRSLRIRDSSDVSDQIDNRNLRTGLAYNPMMLKHECKCGDLSIHPENSQRIQQIWSRLRDAGLISQCTRVGGRVATVEELLTCHDRSYLSAYAVTNDLEQLDLGGDSYPTNRSLCQLACGGVGVDSDTIWAGPATSTAARMAVGCVVDLARKVMSGSLENGFAIVRPPGHHAEYSQAMGFCYFNSIAVTAKLLLEDNDDDRLQGHLMSRIQSMTLTPSRVLILDWDVHHGNGTQPLFYSDPRVLYMSLHRHDNGTFFPGTGSPSDCGEGAGSGFNVNIAWDGQLNPPMGDAEYLAAFSFLLGKNRNKVHMQLALIGAIRSRDHTKFVRNRPHKSMVTDKRSVVMPICRSYRPDIVLVSAGFDAAEGHPAPLGGYNVSPHCFGEMTRQLMTLADGRLVLGLEGGYDIRSTVKSAELCLATLLRHQVPSVSQAELDRRPCPIAVTSLQQVIKYHANYWPVLNETIRYIECSESEYRANAVTSPSELSSLPRSAGAAAPPDPPNPCDPSTAP